MTRPFWADQVQSDLAQTELSESEIVLRYRRHARAEVKRSAAGWGIVPAWGMAVAGILAALGAAGVWRGVSELPQVSVSRDVGAWVGSSSPPARINAVKPATVDENEASRSALEAPLAPSAKPPAALPKKPRPSEVQAAASSAKPEVTWAALAAALRDGNDAEARALVTSLQKSTDPETRDHARLTAVRLQLPAGGSQADLSAEMRADLSDLAEHGASSSIRASARRLLTGGMARAAETPKVAPE
jgi:hypothetical protein